MKYPDAAVDRAKDGALDWLRDNPDGGYPRSWQQEKLHDDRRGYVMYDDWEAPPIAGYEALEREGVVVRVGVVVKSDGEERVHFRLSHPVNPPESGLMEKMKWATKI